MLRKFLDFMFSSPKHYLVNTRTKTIHSTINVSNGCKTSKLKPENTMYVTKRSYKQLIKEGYKECAFCLAGTVYAD